MVTAQMSTSSWKKATSLMENLPPRLQRESLVWKMSRASLYGTQQDTRLMGRVYGERAVLLHGGAGSEQRSRRRLGRWRTRALLTVD